MGPYHRARPPEAALHSSPWAQLLQPSCPNADSSPQAAAAHGAAPAGVSMGCASFRPHPLLVHELLHDCTWRSPLLSDHGLQRDKPAPPWMSPGLQGASAPCLEHILPSFCTDFGAAGLFLSHLLTPLTTAVAQQFCIVRFFLILLFLNLLSQRHTQCWSWLRQQQLEQLGLAVI